MRGPPTRNSGAQDATVRSCSCFLVKYVSFLVFFYVSCHLFVFFYWAGFAGQGSGDHKEPPFMARGLALTLASPSSHPSKLAGKWPAASLSAVSTSPQREWPAFPTVSSEYSRLTWKELCL